MDPITATCIVSVCTTLSTVVLAAIYTQTPLSASVGNARLEVGNTNNTPRIENYVTPLPVFPEKPPPVFWDNPMADNAPKFKKKKRKGIRKLFCCFRK